MKILFHSDSIFGRSSYGLSRYSRELWSAIRQRDPGIQLSAYALRGARYATTNGGSSVPDGFSGISRSRWAGRIEMVSSAALGLPRMERGMADADLIHSVELDYPVATRKPWMVTIHDLGPLTHPQYFAQSKPWLRRQAFAQAVSKADVIVSVSAATATAVEELAGTRLGDRLRVVHEGVGDEFFERRNRDCLVPLQALPPHGEPYFLWTGSLNPRKNLKNVVQAFELVADQVPHHLVLAGGLGWDHSGTMDAIEKSVVRSKIHRPGYVSDEQLQALYQGAEAFLYVSLMEGFGLPILEAMASECPVVTSNISSMPEIAGDAALLVDPAQPAEIGAAMQRLAADAQLRRMLAVRGAARAREFSWQRCADSMIALYREAVSR